MKPGSSIAEPWLLFFFEAERLSQIGQGDDSPHSDLDEVLAVLLLESLTSLLARTMGRRNVSHTSPLEDGENLLDLSRHRPFQMEATQNQQHVARVQAGDPLHDRSDSRMRTACENHQTSLRSDH